MAKLEQAAKMSLKALRAEVRGLDRDQEKAERSGRRMHSSAHRGYRRQKQDVEALRRATLAQTDAITRQGRAAMTLGGRFRRMRENFVAGMRQAGPYMAMAAAAGGAVINRAAERTQQRESAAAGRLQADNPAMQRMMSLAIRGGKIDQQRQAALLRGHTRLRYQYGMPSQQAANLMFELGSQGLLDQVGLFGEFGKTGQDPAAAAKSAGGLLNVYGISGQGRGRTVNKAAYAALQSSMDTQTLLANASEVADYVKQAGGDEETLLAMFGNVKMSKAEIRKTQVKALSNAIRKARQKGEIGGTTLLGGVRALGKLSEAKRTQLLPDEAYGGYQFASSNLAQIEALKYHLGSVSEGTVMKQVQAGYQAAPAAQASFAARRDAERRRLSEELRGGGRGLALQRQRDKVSAYLDEDIPDVPWWAWVANPFDAGMRTALPEVHRGLIETSLETMQKFAPEQMANLDPSLRPDPEQIRILEEMLDELRSGGGRPE